MSFAGRLRAGLSAFRSAYQAGRDPVGRKPWVPIRRTAKQATDGITQKVADRARDAVRNNAYAARIVDLWTANAVGAGITTRWDGQRQAEAWRAWGEGVACDAERRSNWAGIQALAMRAMVESGECVIRRRMVRPTPDNPVGVQLMALEGDALDHTRTGLNGTNRIVQGVEIDAAGAPVAYWLRRDYDSWPLAIASITSDRVPADEVIHLFRRRRPGQVRDVSWLAPVLWSLRDLGTYEGALLRKAEIEACLSVIVNDNSEDTATGGLVTDANGQAVEDIQPGLILYRRGVGEIETVAPTGGGSHAGYAKRTLEGAAVGTGLTYDMISGDLSQANYSSLRAGKIEFRRLLEQVQYTLLIPVLVDRVAAWFFAAGVVQGLWPEAASGRTHTPPTPEMVDPLKDTTALIHQVRAGFVPLPEAVAAFGYEFRQNIGAIREANEALDDAGISVDTDPRRVAQSGAAQDAAQMAAIEIAATGAAAPPAPAAEPAPQ
jgi:lambda family phage portal protein